MNDKVLIAVGCASLIAASALGGWLLSRALKTKKYKKSPLHLSDGFTYTAHTGCVNTKDNSLDSIDAAVQYGADIVEIDLNFTADGQPVLSHDDPVGGEVSIDEAFEKISKCDGLKVNVDVKNTANLRAVVNAAEKHGITDRFFYTGITEEFVDAVKRDTPEVTYYLNVPVKKRQTDAYLQSLVEKVRNSGAVGINFNKDNATQKLVDLFHENNMLVSIWTVNDEPDIYRILSLSPDNITTRRPDRIQKIIQK
ncbi:MAG: glycerophosphodiester phosphodiesterase [Clostridia bacterium]|nr:glycerophosphodiester phosphodiesterase [Clostridia bacterium]